MSDKEKNVNEEFLETVSEIINLKEKLQNIKKDLEGKGDEND